MTIRIRLSRLPHGEGLPLPSYATHGAAGMDVVAAEELDLMPGQRHAVATGFKVAIPEGYEIQVRPRLQGLRRYFFAFFLAGAFRLPFDGPLAALASINATASTSVTALGSADLGSVAWVDPSLT